MLYPVARNVCPRIFNGLTSVDGRETKDLLLVLGPLLVTLVCNLMVEKARLSILIVTSFLAVSTAVRNQETAPPSDEGRSDDDLRIRGIFESILPNTDEQHTLTAMLNPHFGDLHRYSYLRVPLGIRYG